MTQAHESRPEMVAPEAAKSFGGDCNQYSGPTDITTLSNAEWDRCMEFYASGYTHGSAAGRKYADEEAVALHRAAAEVVLNMVKVPERDRAEDRARRQRIDARFGGAK